MAVNGALATTVADLALAHAVLAGEEPAPPAAPGRPLRIAVSTRSPVPGVRADGPASAAVDEVVALLTAAGHTVVRRNPPITHGRRGRRAGALDGRGGGRRRAPRASSARRCSRAAARTPGWAGSSAGPGCCGRGRRSGSGSAWSPGSPTSTCCSARSPPVRRCPPGRGTSAPSWPTSRPTRAGRPGRAAWNLAGLPALVLPAGTRPEGLPLAVQFVGPPGAEGRLLWLAGELERQQPWRRYAPVFDPTAPPAAAPV